MSTDTISGILLKLKNPVDDGHISDIRNFTLQDDEEENDSKRLISPRNTLLFQVFQKDNEISGKQNVGLPTLEFDRNTSKRTTTDMVVLNSHYEFSLKHLSYITYYNESMPSKRFSRLQNEDLTKWSCY
ncbi:hypothetical protein RCL_jg26132.t2 [Rhizophagus clarus]|uniref:Uncharacterized protein n=1 Tax=Rhizophagus clarus TaxID=94130 RepID=A0A8H3QAQ5_9GLOM|nr:hypothetical protein RCL_jg26132.t2 [Rhizophagus clarus]